MFLTGVSQGCGGSIHVSNTTVTISSVDTDSNGQYEPQQECVWVLTTGDYSILRVHFDSFHLQPQQPGHHCQDADYLEVQKSKETVFIAVNRVGCCWFFWWGVFFRVTAYEHLVWYVQNKAPKSQAMKDVLNFQTSIRKFHFPFFGIHLQGWGSW